MRRCAAKHPQLAGPSPHRLHHLQRFRVEAKVRYAFCEGRKVRPLRPSLDSCPGHDRTRPADGRTDNTPLKGVSVQRVRSNPAARSASNGGYLGCSSGRHAIGACGARPRSAVPSLRPRENEYPRTMLRLLLHSPTVSRLTDRPRIAPVRDSWVAVIHRFVEGVVVQIPSVASPPRVASAGH
jgi:hypothetical protein